jgi:four helix bundle protein
VGREDAPLGRPRSSATKRVVSRFEDLDVWQTARELTRGVFKACGTQRLADEKPLASQMKRAAVSIGSNIAEGYERGTRKQQIEHCFYAKGSAGELRSQVITAHDVGLLNEEARRWLLDMCERVSRQLAMYIAHLKRTQKTIPGVKMAEERPRALDAESSTSHLPAFPPSHVTAR